MNCLNIDMLLSKITATLTHEKTGALHTLTGELPSVELYTVRFKAVQPYKKGDTFQLGEDAYIAQNIDGTVLEDDAFVTNALVSIEVDTIAKKVNFQCHTATAVPPVDPPIDPPTDEKICLPASWINKRTGQAKETISKYDAVVMYQSGGQEDVFTALPDLEGFPKEGLGAETTDCRFSPDGNFLAILMSSKVPYIVMYKREETNFVKLHFDQPPTQAVRKCYFSPDNQHFVITMCYGEPSIIIYKRDKDRFVRITDLSLSPDYDILGCAFSPNNQYLAATYSGVSSAPCIVIYKKDDDVFTKLENIPSIPASCNGGNDCAFSPDSNYLAVATNAVPHLIIYKRDGDNFSQLPNSNVTQEGFALNCAFSFDGSYLATGSSIKPFLTIYKRENDVFTALTEMNISLSDTVYKCAFSPDGRYLSIFQMGSPYLQIYRRNGDTFTKVTDPPYSDTAYGGSMDFSPDSKLLATALYVDPFCRIYEISASNITVQKLSTASLAAIKQEGGTCLGIGVALQDASQGEQCEVNLFPPINNELERFANISFEPDTNQA